MSLKSFHLFFIVISILLSAFVSYWGFAQGNAIAYPSVAAAVALVVYLFWFLSKGKKKGSVVLPCAVCFGLADPQTTTALNSSVLFMIGITAVVLAGLTYMILRIVKSTQL